MAKHPIIHRIEVLEESVPKGVSPWEADITYKVPALVYGSNAELYEALQESQGKDPTNPDNNIYWRRNTDRTLELIIALS